LSVQASFVASECIFSNARDIVTATRSCFDPQCVDQLIFLKKKTLMKPRTLLPFFIRCKLKGLTGKSGLSHKYGCRLSMAVIFQISQDHHIGFSDAHTCKE
jgi:hypothetical protein